MSTRLFSPVISPACKCALLSKVSTSACDIAAYTSRPPKGANLTNYNNAICLARGGVYAIQKAAADLIKITGSRLRLIKARNIRTKVITFW
jgi:hypothetical protein